MLKLNDDCKWQMITFQHTLHYEFKLKSILVRLISIISPNGTSYNVVPDEGKVLACGDNKSGQTVGGAGTAMNKTPQLINHDGAPIVRITCGADFSAILDIGGTVW